ncbi:LOW QUALITY PROTEIN: uncharacterized protein [Amphiura filiformis]|uniref:LOW QUALITY PROTEIN: uncharacterized protein n=1 Tax=Amphiura filiformis TaxID=82378 RepID=UPI003B228010
MSSKRPKRAIIQKKLEYNEGMLWQEERDLRRALYASLHPGRLKDSDDEEEGDGHEVKLCNNHVCHPSRTNYDAASCTSNSTARTVTSAPATPTVGHGLAMPGKQPFSTSSAPVTPTMGSVAAPTIPTLAAEKSLPTSTSDDDLARTIERVIQNGIKALAEAKEKNNSCVNNHVEKCIDKLDLKEKVKEKLDLKEKIKDKAKRKEKVKDKVEKKEKDKEKSDRKDKEKQERKEKKHRERKERDKDKAEKKEKDRSEKKEKDKSEKKEKDKSEKKEKTSQKRRKKTKKKVKDKSEKKEKDKSEKKVKDKSEKKDKDKSEKSEKKEKDKADKKEKAKLEKNDKDKSEKKEKDKSEKKVKDKSEKKVKDKSEKKDKDRSEKKEKDKSEKKDNDKLEKKENSKSEKKEKDKDQLDRTENGQSKADKKEKVKEKSERKANEKVKPERKDKDKDRTETKNKVKTERRKKDKDKVETKDKVGRKVKNDKINNCNKGTRKVSSRERLMAKAREKQKEKARQKLKEKLTKKSRMTKEKIVKKIRRSGLRSQEERKQKMAMETLRNRSNQRKTMVQRRRESMAEVLLKKQIMGSMAPPLNYAAMKNNTSGTKGAQGASNTAIKTKKPCLKAQRKFAQSLPSSPSTTPLSTPLRAACGSSGILLNYCPKTEDFLTFLCLRESPSLPPHLDLFGISEQIQDKAEPPDFPSEFPDDIRIPGVEPLPADRPGSPASSLTTTEEESATESCMCEKGAIRARAPYNATCRGTAKPCSSELHHRRTLAPPCLTPLHLLLLQSPLPRTPPLICMVPTKTDPESPNNKMPKLKMPSLKRPNTLHTRGPNNRLTRPVLVKEDQRRTPTSTTVRRNNRVLTNGLKKEEKDVKKVRKEVKRQRGQRKVVNNVHHKANNVVVRKLKRKRKVVDYAEASSGDSMDEFDGRLKTKKRKPVKKECPDEPSPTTVGLDGRLKTKKRKPVKAERSDEPSPTTVNSNLKNHKHKQAINLLVKSKRIRHHGFSRKSSIQLLHDSKLLLRGKVRENLKITVNSFTNDSTVKNNVKRKNNHVMDDLDHVVDSLELPVKRTSNHNDLNNHEINPYAFDECDEPVSPVRRRGRPPGSKNKPKLPNAAKSPKSTSSAASTSNSHHPSYNGKVNANGKDHNAAPSSSTTLQDAPVFHPTQEEWRDPMEYIKSIAEQGELSGMCKIIPPKGWRPECKVDDDMRFTPQVQYIHRLLKRWGSNVQELACIKRHVAAQNNDVAQSPQIGGCELDLVKFSQIVMQQGGLKTITSKQKWNKVADQLKIPKTIQNRVCKLDSIYCKYLLSYDTLTKEEKDKLLADVEAERKQNAAKKSNRHMKGGSTECQAFKGRTLSLVQFCRTANHIRQMHFKNEPCPAEVERDYWHVIEEGQSHVAVHRASLDTSVTGSGFPTCKTDSYAKHNWNLTNVSNNNCNMLHVLPGRMGITSPELKLGMLYSTETWNCDRHSLPSIEYLHSGAPKIWYCIPSSEVNRTEKLLQTNVPNLCPRQQQHLLMNQSFLCMIPPQVLLNAGIPVRRIEQNCEEFVVTFPGAAACSISCGYNVAEAIHCASPSWLATGVQSFKLSRLLRQPCHFSMDQLLCLLATKVGSHSNRCMLQVMLTELKAIREREIRYRKELCEAGLKSSIRFGEPESPSRCRERRGKTLAKSAEEKYCCVCKFACYLSMVVNEKEDSVYCLEHGLEQAQKSKACTCRNLKLMYRYDETQLGQVVQDVAEAIASQPKLRKSSKDLINTKARTTKTSTSPTVQKFHSKDFPNSSTTSAPSIPRNCLVKGMSAATNKLRASPDTPASQVTPPQSAPKNSPSPKGTPQEPTVSPKSPSRSRRNSSSSTTSLSSKPTLRSTSPRGGTPIGSPKGSPRGTPRGSPRHTPAFASKPVAKTSPKLVPRNSPKISPVVVLNNTMGDSPPAPPTTRSHVKVEPEEGVAL